MKYAVNLFHCLNCVPWFVIISTVINVLFVLVSLILAKFAAFAFGVLFISSYIYTSLRYFDFIC